MDMESSCPGGAAAPDADATLQAVLAFLDANDTTDYFGDTSSESTAVSSPSQSLSDGDSSPKSLPPETPKPAAGLKKPSVAGSGQRPPRVHSDKRQRAEMIALREESLALQDRLDEFKRQLNQSHSNKNRPMQDADGDDAQKDELRHLRAQAWQAMAEAQQKRRAGAEAERAQLRELIDQQKKSFRQLRRYVLRHAKKNTGEAPAIVDDDTVTASETDDADFEQISSTIPTMHLQTGALFTDSRLDNVVTSMRDLKIQNEASNKMSIEALESSVVPFDIQTTADAVWQHHHTKALCNANSSSYLDTVDATDTRIRRTFKTIVDKDEMKLRARGRMETRRYNEANRVVIVQSVLVDRIEFSSVPLPNFAIRHFQWTVIEPPRNAMLRDSGKPLSQVEIYGVNMPTISELPKSDLRDTIKSDCIATVGLQLEFERQSVENILMEKLVQGAHVDSKMLHIPQW